MATPAAIVTGAQRVRIASARLDAVGEASVARAPPRPRGCRAGRTRAPPQSRGLRLPSGRVGVADHGHRLRASCQTVGTAAECVVTVRIISSLRVSVASILCG